VTLGPQRRLAGLKTTRILKDALIIAAEAAGAPQIEYDNETGRIISAEPGPGGLHAYLLNAALYHPRTFLNMLAKCMPYQLNMKTDVAEPRVYESVEEVRKEIIERGLDKLLRPEVVIPMKRKN
jgi:hypothetical protein